MVDSITGSGSTQALDAIKRAEKLGKPSEQGTSVSGTQDTVEISAEALDLAQAEGAAQVVREQIEANPKVTLGLDPNFDTRV